MKIRVPSSRLLIAVLVATVVSACGGGGGSSDTLTPPQPDGTGVRITGMVSKGPLDSSGLEFFPIDATGAVAGGAIAGASTTTNPDGSFATVIPAGTGAVLIRTSGGTYTDEADREPDPALKRRILLSAGEGLETLLPAGETSVMISIASDALLRKSRRETQGDTFLGQFEANRALATTAFGFDIVTTPAADPVSPDPGVAVEQRQYAMVLGGLANLVNRVSLNAGFVEPNIETILAVSEDFSDGRVDGLVAGDPVLVSGEPIEAFSLNDEINRFRNNNFDSYAGTPLVVVDEDVFSQVNQPVNTIPVAVADTYILDAGGALTIDSPGVLFNDTDADGDTLTAILVSGPANAVDFALAADGSFFYAHDGTTSDPDSFSYRANDGVNDSNVATVTLTFTNTPPVANDDVGTVLEGGLLAGPSVLSNDTDLDGDPLTATLVDSPVNGQLTFNPDGTYEYTHDGSETISDQFSYVANDGTVDSNAAQVLLTVTPVNDAPIGLADSATVDEGGTTTVLDDGSRSVLANDTDAEMNPLTAALGVLPVNGQLMLGADGTFSYTHDGGETTSDSFTYVVSDGVASSAPVNVDITINPVNDPPIAGDDFMTVDQGETQTILDSGAASVLANDSDAESDPLTAMLVDPPLNGQLNLNADGTFSYTHDGSQTPNDEFTYIANDGIDESNIVSVFIQINIPNAVPVAEDDSFSVDEGGIQTVLDSGTDSVLDNDFDDNQDPLEAILVDAPLNGELMLEPDGRFTYTHNGSETLDDSFTYVANDGIDDSDFAVVSITINPVNDAPVGVADSLTLNQGDTETVLDSGETSVLANDSDPEGDTLTALLQFGPQHGDFTLNPDGTFSYAHDGSATTSDSFTYIPSDADVEFSTVITGADGPDGGLFTPGEAVVIRYDLDATVADVNPDPGTGTYPDATQRLLFSFPTLGLEFDFSLGTVQAFDNTPNPDDQISIFGSVNQGSSTLNGQGVTGVELGYTGLTSMLANDAIPDFLPNDVQFFSGAFTTANGTTQVIFSVPGISTVVPTSASAAPVQVDIVINPFNNAPVAFDDEMEVDEGGTQTRLTSDDESVLDNDFDDDMDPLTAVLVDPPANGDLTLNPDGTFSYTHDGSETSNDSFTYVANDGTDDSLVAQVSILVNSINDPPIAMEDSLTVDEGGDQSLLDSGADSVLANDSDAENNPLTATVVDSTSNGLLTLNPDGTFTYEHDGSETQGDSFVYVANDGEDDSGPTSVSILINPINDVPFADDDAATVVRGGFVNLLDSGADTVLANDFDEEDDPLTAQLIDLPQNGMLTLNPDGTFEYQHDGSPGDVDSFTYTANDGLDDSNLATVDIAIAPGINADLSDLLLTDATLVPSFSPDQFAYTATVPFTVTDTQVTPTAADAGATITVNGSTVASGVASDLIPLNEGSNTITVIVTAEDGVTTETYTVDLTRQTAAAFAQAAYIKASNPDAEDIFAFAVSLSADGDTLIVGAYGESSAATGVDGNQTDNSVDNAGAVYVFVRDAVGEWVQEAYLKASISERLDSFGIAVAVAGDGNTVVVGASGESSNATGVGGDQSNNIASISGAVYVFRRDNGLWSQQAYIKASNTETFDQFGLALDLSADGRTLAVGAENEDSAATGIDGDQSDNAAIRAGAVYVYTLDGAGVWSQQAYIKASNTDAMDFFGSAVSLAADGATLVVGANGEDSAAVGIGGDQVDNTAADSGATYVFVRDTFGIWSQQAYIKASNADSGDLFGWSVELSGSGNSLAVGSPDERSSATGIDGDQVDNSGIQYGAVYLFDRDGAGVWSQQAYAKASNAGSPDQFGYSLSLSADGDRLLVGAILEASSAAGIDADQTDNSLRSGAAYLFDRDAGIWSQTSYIKATNPGSDDNFGFAVALSANRTTFVSGTPRERSAATGVDGDQADNSLPFAGAAYVFTEIGSGSSDANLGNLALNNGTLDQPFDPGTFDYTATVPFTVSDTQVSAAAADAGGEVLINGVDYGGGTSDPIPLDVGVTTISILVTAEDGTTQAYTIAITRQSSGNSAPTAIDLDNDSVQAGQPPGTPVGTFSTTDPDAGDTHLYSLVAGAGDDDNALFQIVGDQLQTATTLDDVQSTRSILVRTDDQNGGILDELFIITVLPGNIPPTAIDLDNMSVDEGEPIGTPVGVFTTEDPDAGDTHVYTLVAGPGGEGNSFFQIVADELQTAEVLDSNQTPELGIRVQSDDLNGGSIQETFIISVNNLPDQRSWINPLDGDWNEPANWSPFGVPQPGEAVIIDLVGAGPMITLSEGIAADVFSVDCTETIVLLTDTSLTVHGPSSFSGSTTLAVDSALFVDGPDADVSISGAPDLGGGNLIVTGGGVLSIDMPTYFTDSNRSWFADGPNSRLEFFDLISVQVGMPGTDSGPTLSIEASGGGVIDFQLLDSILIDDGTSVAENESWVDVLATGAGSRVQMPQLQTFVDADRDSDEPGLSVIEAQGGGVITFPMLTDPVGVNLRIDSASSVDIAQLTSVANSVLELDGGVFAFPNLTDLTGSTVRLGPAATASVDLFAVVSLDSGGAEVYNGSVLSLPGVTSYAMTQNVVNPPDPTFGGDRSLWQADGTGSRLELPNLLSGELSGDDNGPFWIIAATAGGVVDLPSLTSLTVFADGGSGVSDISIEATGAGSRVQAPQVTTFVDQDASGTFGDDMSRVTVEAGGVVEFPMLPAADRVFLNTVDAMSSINVPLLTTLTNGALVLEGGGNFIFPNLTDLSGSSVIVEGEGTALDLPAVTMFDNGGVSVSDGVSLSLPGVTSYTLVTNTGLGEQQFFSAEDPGSRLEFPNLTSVQVAGIANGPHLEIEAFAGGVVDLPLLDSLTVSDDGGPLGSEIVLRAAEPDSLVDLPVLTLFNDLDLDSMSTIEEINTGVVNFPGTAVLMNVSAPVNNPPVAVADSYEVTSGGTLTIGGGGLQRFIDGMGQLTGAAGIDVAGESYDVTFVNGTCVVLFEGCDELSDFDFPSETAADDASQALMDQVFLDVAEGMFDTDPFVTRGCDGSGISCNTLTPYEPLPLAGNVLATWAFNASAENIDAVQNNVLRGVNDDTTGEARTWALWSESPQVGVLANDTDADNDTLTAVLIDDVTDGMLSLAADGTFSYTHGGVSQVDSFTYRAFDGTDFSQIVTVTITVVLDPDSDGDGLSDDVEIALGTNPNDPDTDGDLVSDFEEVNVDGDPFDVNVVPGGDTDPLSPDTDSDDVGDGIELRNQTDPHVADNVLHVGGTFANDINDGLSWSQAFETNAAVINVLTVSDLNYYVLYEAGTYEPFVVLDPASPQFHLVGSVGPGVYAPVDPPDTVFDATGNGPVAVINNAQASLNNISLVNGLDTTGLAGGLNALGTSEVSIFSSLILDNESQLSGGGFLVEQPATLLAFDLLVSGNVSQSSGGGGFVAGNLLLFDSIFADNQAVNGGTLTLDQGPVGFATIEDSQFLANQGTRGGAIDIVSSGLGLIAKGNLIAGNFVSGEGGAINATGPSDLLSTNVSLNTVAYNQAAGSGGGFVGLNGCDDVVASKSATDNIFYFNDDNDTGARTLDDNFLVNRFVGRVCGQDAKDAFDALVVSAGDTKIDFESLPTGTNLTTQIPGVSFASISNVFGNPSGPFHVEVSMAFPSIGNSIVGAPCGGCTDDGRVRYEIVFDTPHRRAGLRRIWNEFTTTRFFDDQGGLLYEFTGGPNGANHFFVGYVAPGADTATWVKRIEIDGELDGVTRQAGYTDDLYFGDADVGPTDFGLGASQGLSGNDIEGGPLGFPGFAADPLFVAGFYLDQAASPAVDASGGDAGSVFVDGETTDPAGMPDIGMIDIGYHHADAAGPRPDGVGPDNFITGYPGGPIPVEFFLQSAQQNLTKPGQIVGVCIGAGTTFPNAQISSLTTLDPVPGCNSVLARDLGDGRFEIDASGDAFATGVLILDVYINESPSPLSLTVDFGME